MKNKNTPQEVETITNFYKSLSKTPSVVDQEYQVNKKGQKHGYMKQFYPSSQLSYQTEYKNNDWSGLCKYKERDNRFVYVSTQNKNELFGVFIYFKQEKK